MKFAKEHIWWIVAILLILIYNGNLASFGLPSSILPGVKTT